jgi:MoaA/NifB/PqqE/SkfB family radical SAM enzyme
MIKDLFIFRNKFFPGVKTADLYASVKNYLPRERFKELMNAWFVNNLIKGPKKRKKFQKENSYTLPGTISLSPSHKCNLRCRGCYASSYNQNAEMKTEEIEKIIQEANDLGIFLINILGGEPFLRKDLFSLFEKHKDVAFRISTNGTLLDSDILDSLKRAGNVVVFFSLEGLEQETDSWRGKGIFEQIKENMSLLKEERLLFGFSALLHDENKDILISEKFLDYMNKLGTRLGVYFPYGPVGENHYYELVIEENELKSCFEKLEATETHYSMLLFKEGYRSPKKPQNHVLNQGCRAGYAVHITPEGYVEPCNGIQFYTDNIFDVGLKEIFKSPFYREIFSVAQENEGRCIAIYRPIQVLEIIEKHGAKGSNEKSFHSITQYIQHLSQKFS